MDIDDLNTESEILDAFKKTVKEFAEEVRVIVTAIEKDKKKLSNDDIKDTTKIGIICNYLIDLFQPIFLIKHYVEKVVPYKQEILDKDEIFFLEHDELYPGAPENYKQMFKNLWIYDFGFSDNEKETMWEFFDVLVELAEKWRDLTGYVPKNGRIV